MISIQLQTAGSTQFLPVKKGVCYSLYAQKCKRSNFPLKDKQHIVISLNTRVSCGGKGRTFHTTQPLNLTQFKQSFQRLRVTWTEPTSTIYKNGGKIHVTGTLSWGGKTSPNCLAERVHCCLYLDGKDEMSDKESHAPGRSQSQLISNVLRLDSSLWVYNLFAAVIKHSFRSLPGCCLFATSLPWRGDEHFFSRGARTAEPWSAGIGWKISGTFLLTPEQCNWRSFVDAQGHQTGPS